MKAAIITSSDKGYAGEREDVSGQVMDRIFQKRCDTGSYKNGH